jgi:hypothetical protein
MKVVMLSNTALAASPYEAWRCLNKYTDLEVRWIAWKTHYNDGRRFPSDILWTENRGKCEQLIREADVIHIHNEYFMGDRTCALFRDKPILLQAHSVPKRPVFESRLPDFINVAYTIDQPMQKEAYGLPALPNLIDCEEYTPITKTNTFPTLLFAPTNSFHRKRPGSKAKDDVVEILQRVDSKRVVIDHFCNLPYEQNLKRKQRADIIIDDVVAQTFHRTTLEGCCFGACVLTGSKGPWLNTSLGNLESRLRQVIENPVVMKQTGKKCRHWVETEWHPKVQCQRYVDAYEKLLR